MANDIASLGLRVDSSEVDKGTESLKRLASAGEKAEASAKKVEESAGQATKAIKEQKDEVGRLLGSIDPATRALDKLDQQERKLAQFRSSNKIDIDTYRQYKSVLDQSREAISRQADALNRTGITAKQTAAALRGVPAQFTDIVVSLQGGQAPLTVLLQQGGQLKDMFGGIGPAARALGGYVAGLVNPFTVAAAAAAALAFAYKQGSDEGSVFQRALIVTGNQSGQTADSMANLARQVSSVTGTTGAAADALTQIVATGRIASDQFKNIAIAAVAFESATGQAVEHTVAQFQKLAEDPAKASAALNEQYHYLTASVYEQIRALEEQGDKVGAANLAEETYASALQVRSNAIKQNLGYIEAAWDSIKSKAKAAYDAMLDIGREQTIDDKISSLRKDIEAAQNSSAKSYKDQAAGQGAYTPPAQIAAMQARLRLLQQERDTQKSASEASEKAARAEQESIAGRNELHKRYLAGLDREAKKNLEIEKIDIARRQALGGKDVDVGQINREYEVSRKKIEEDFEKSAPKTRKPAAYQDDAATRMLLSLKEQEATLRSQLTTNEKLTASQRALAQFEQQIADLKTKGTLTAQQKSLQANELQIRAQLEQNVALEDEIKKREQLTKLQAFQQSLEASRAQEREGYADQLAGSTLGPEARQRLQAEQKIRQDYQRQLERAARDRTNGSITEDTYRAETEALKQNLDERLAMQQEYYSALDELNGNAAVGAQRAISEYSEQAKNIADQTQNFVGGTLENLTTGIADSLTDAITHTKDLGDAMASLGETILTQVVSSLIEMGARYAINAALEVAGLTTVQTAKAALGATAGAGYAAAVTGQSTAEVNLAALNAFASTAAIPIVGPALAPAAAATAAAATAPFAAAAIAAASSAIAGAATGGFSEGGYTGPGGKYDPAGIVHKGEVVWSQADIARAGGVATVESLRKGYAPNGNAGLAGTAPGKSGGGGVVVNLHEDASKAGQVQQINQSSGGMTMDVYVANIQQGGPAARAIEQAYGLRRVGR
ncbi:lambda family phage tail tape measure protein [Pseudomonas luteola]|uniref:Lambda family phage tail tape measure protein n=1 Tax=Pseudomonas luteola TaxID=47886 RepID=A0A2X2ELD4_PSELU|nr:phage tail length tape measure family protein [Pseudomonas luteola]SPZ07480.1 lambda family phage tail tape measure protein [Pseudomonas luteola]